MLTRLLCRLVAVAIAAGATFGSLPVSAGAETIVGSQTPDFIGGTPRPDVIRGLGGNDLVHGRGGNDRLFGGAGRDQLYGGRDADRLVGGAGNDVLVGGPGNDRISVRGFGRDSVTCGGGSDQVLADARDDVADDCEVRVGQGNRGGAPPDGGGGATTRTTNTAAGSTFKGWYVFVLLPAIALAWLAPLVLDIVATYRARGAWFRFLDRLAETAGADKLTRTELDALIDAHGGATGLRGGIPGLARALMALTITTVVALALVLLMTAANPADRDLVKTVVVALTGGLTTIIGFYFGARTAQEPAERAGGAAQSAAGAAEAAGAAQAAAEAAAESARRATGGAT